MRLAGLFLFLSIMTLGCSVANAGPSSHRIKQGSGLLDSLFGDDDAGTGAKPAEEGKRLDTRLPQDIGYGGVWRDGSGRTLLIKRIHRTLFLSGSSDTAAWQAQCVMSMDAAKCLGSGISKTQGEFRYESDLRLGDAGLQVDWHLKYSNGHSDSGRSTHHRAL